MKLDRRHIGFKADEITYLDRKSIMLDRAMLKLFELLRFDGRPPARWRKMTINVPELVKLMTEHPERFPGFAGHEEIAATWLRSDLLQVMNRGKGERETVVGPRPMHLNAYKLANASAVQDYGASDQVWALLCHADPGLLNRLKDFFSPGLDYNQDQYDGTTELDLETHAILGLVDQLKVSQTSTQRPPPIRPLCLGQGRLLADDLRSLLAYTNRVPRHVLAGYMRTVIGLHLALFMLRLLQLLPARVEAALRGDPTPACPAEEQDLRTCESCPFATEVVVDLSDDHTSGPGRLARASTTAALDRLPGYIRAVYFINRLKDFAILHDRRHGMGGPLSVSSLLELLRTPPANMDGFFDGEILRVLELERNDEQDPIVELILSEDRLSSLEKFVELICIKRLANERKQLIGLIDSLTQKNRRGGFMRQTAGRSAPRWFALDSHLLETLVQIAVVERQQDGTLRTRTILLDDFIEWLRRRYGFIVYAPTHREVAPEEHEAWQENEQRFRQRLHEIGFFTDLSDAYNSQTLRPRYQVEHA
jgi:hypothetical protein